MLTTYNEVDMSAVMALRSEYKDLFEKKHGVKLGFMSFFTKACCHALREVPEVNAEIDGTDIVYKNFVHMGVAAGTPTGLVVPVIRNVDTMSFADIEKAIAEKGKRARDGKLSMAEMQGGTFTISNGGVYGSLMSSPILNPPQSGILGMHKIQDRPMAEDGRDRDPPDDVSRAVLRPPHRRRQGGGDLPGARQRSAGRSAAVADGSVTDETWGWWQNLPAPSSHDLAIPIVRETDTNAPMPEPKCLVRESRCTRSCSDLTTDLLNSGAIVVVLTRFKNALPRSRIQREAKSCKCAISAFFVGCVPQLQAGLTI